MREARNRLLQLRLLEQIEFTNTVRQGTKNKMTWIKTVSMWDDERVKAAIEAERKLYPQEYATPVPAVDRGFEASIVGSHTLLPDVLFHAFSAFGAMLAPELPLQRRQHEMIATMVSITNRCHY
jgi:hypothetical protein